MTEGETLGARLNIMLLGAFTTFIYTVLKETKTNLLVYDVVSQSTWNCVDKAGGIR
jgi:hypothetical protein